MHSEFGKRQPPRWHTFDACSGVLSQHHNVLSVGAGKVWAAAALWREIGCCNGWLTEEHLSKQVQSQKRGLSQ